MFDWEDLRHFGVFAQESSLSGAARRLKVDHATVARRIAALESSLGLKLVDRRPRSYLLTAEGERIAALAARMEHESYAVERTAAAGQTGVSGEVTISAPPSMAAAVIAPRLGQLRARHPALRVCLTGATRVASLTRREADLAVRLSRPAEGELVVRKLGTVAFSLYACAAYLDATAPSDYGYIAYDDSMEGSPQQEWLKQQALGRPIVMVSNELDIQASAARAGVGIAALPHFLGERDGALRRVKCKGKRLTREIWLVVHADIRRAPRIQAVMQFLGLCFAEHGGLS
ncbi:LysR family transcriptional regulator [Cupriavidus sp. 2TAF22]|uniref:LysR family transcriptional regulator n=1 Tax=unclassified Cupriavidus TaxID=2640874 RepID=UPI003F935DDC